MNKVLALVFPALLLTSACMPAGYLPAPYPGPHGTPWAPRPPVPPAASAPLPVGRWDNVMMLAVDTSLQVLTTDGTVMHGRFVAATSSLVRIRDRGQETALDADLVMRVDRFAGSEGRRAAREGAKGAAVGLGVVGVIGLLTGHVPPAGAFGAGALIGAGAGIYNAQWLPGSTMVYLAPSVGHR